MTFDRVDDHNPDWLNRVLVRLKECDLALPPTSPRARCRPSSTPGAPTSIPAALESGTRPTPLEAWQADQTAYRRFLTRLAAGHVAVAPFRSLFDTTGPTPVRVILGDYLGVAGVIRQQAGASTFGDPRRGVLARLAARCVLHAGDRPDRLEPARRRRPPRAPLPERVGARPEPGEAALQQAHRRRPRRGELVERRVRARSSGT